MSLPRSKSFRCLRFTFALVLAGPLAGPILAPLAARAESGPLIALNPPSLRIASPLNPASAGGLPQAAEANRGLLNSLAWTFGGKLQTGWEIYVPLIRRTLGTAAAPESPAFAAALAQWQRSSGLPASGVLNQATMMALVSRWQGQRIKHIAEANPADLIDVSPTQFFDPSRPQALRQVEKGTLSAYENLVNAARNDPSLREALAHDGMSPDAFLKIVSSFRPQSYQNQLRSASPNSGRAGLASHSPHLTGKALDVYVGAEPVSTQSGNRLKQVHSAVYLWLVQNADKYGFYPYFYEPWHWEHVQ